MIKQEAVKKQPPRPPQPPISESKPKPSQETQPLQAQSEEEIVIAPITSVPPPSIVAVDSIVSHEVSETAAASVDASNLSPVVPTLSDALDNMLPSSVGGATGWNPLAETDSAALPTPDIEITQPASEAEIPGTDLVETDNNLNLPVTVPVSVDDTPLSEADPAVPVVSETQHPSGSVLLGRWDVSETDDGNVDFGFGSFGTDNDAASVEEANDSISNIPSAIVEPAEAPKEPEIPANTNTIPMSPARPPPGLSITGMPPIPANAVSVHELEGKLESVSLAAKKHSEETKEVPASVPPATSTQSLENNNKSNELGGANQMPYPPHGISASHPDSNPILANQSYAAAYGMGMYNYNGANVGNGFMGIHTPNGPLLGGLPQQPQQQKLQQQNTSNSQQPQQQQQQQQQQGGAQTGVPQHLHQHQGQQQQGGLYGSSVGGAGLAGSDASGSDNGNNANTTAAGIPPGMPATMPYNPQLFYGQQYYQMGQPHGGVGYGHAGFGQFPGGVQSSYGYQQVNAYGQHYDDSGHGLSNSHHNNNSHQQNYPKNNQGSGSGYRGRNNNNNNNHHNSHSNSHQYQNQYNPQHAGYGAQPYGMGYGVDQFNRGGYGPGNMDPYSMQHNNSGYGQSGGQHFGSGGFNQDDHDHQLPHKGKSKGSHRGNNGGFSNSNIQQYQQVPPQQEGQQQSLGFQGNQSDSTGAGGGSNNAGWGTNQGWGGSSWQGN